MSNSDFIAAFALPERDRESDHEGQTERLIALGGDARELLSRDIKGAAGKDSGDLVEMLRDAGRIRKEAIDRNESRQGWKDREQAIVGHTGGEREDAVLGDVSVDSKQDVFPSLGRNLGRRFGLPASILAFDHQADRRGVAIGWLSAGKSFAFIGPGCVLWRCQAVPQKRHRKKSQRCGQGPCHAIRALGTRRRDVCHRTPLRRNQSSRGERVPDWGPVV
ncbi:hypothetical protein ACVIYL_004401 [Bradyrhizobium sp. USDA 3315]